MGIIEIIKQPWPWYVSGPLIGLTVPLLLLIGNKAFGVSSSLKHVCAMFPSKNPFFNYDWRKEGLWNILFVLGIAIGGFLAVNFIANPESLKVAASTSGDLAGMGIETTGAYAPAQLFSWASLFTVRGLIMMVGGGFLIGFGTRYAGGCTSGHAISGLSNLQWPSLVAVIGFFIGGLLMTHFLLPMILGL